MSMSESDGGRPPTSVVQASSFTRTVAQGSNSSSPYRKLALDKLPPEIIAEILQYLADCATTRGWCSDRSHNYSEDHDWTAITRVNKSLRSLSLSLPRLWTYIPSLPVGRARAFFKRSRNQPFSYQHFDMSHTDEETTALFKTVFSQHFRIRDLDLGIDMKGEITLEEFQHLLLVPMPFLRSLRIWFDLPSNLRIQHLRIEDAPNLQFVMVARNLLVLTPPLTNVTKLELLLKDVDFDVDELVHLLNGMPKLCTLWLSKPTTDTPADPEHAQPTDIRLPNLKNFELIAWEHSFELFLYCATLVAPQLRHLRVNYVPGYHGHIGCVGPETALPSFLSILDIHRVEESDQHLVIVVTEEGIEGVALTTTPSEPCRPGFSTPLLFEYEEADMDFERISASLPLHALRSLTIRGRRRRALQRTPEIPSPPGHAAWVDALASSHTLTHIQLETLRTLTTLLCRCAGSPSAFPSLRRITIKNVVSVRNDQDCESRAARKLLMDRAQLDMTRRGVVGVQCIGREPIILEITDIVELQSQDHKSGQLFEELGSSLFSTFCPGDSDA